MLMGDGRSSASCFLTLSKEMCGFHSLLPRVLAVMSQEGDPAHPATGSTISDLEHLLSQDHVYTEHLKSETVEQADVEWQKLVEELMECKDLSHAELNAKRKRLTFGAFRDPDMVQKINILEALVAPNVRTMHIFFSRTEAIGAVQRLPDVAADERAQQESKPLVRDQTKLIFSSFPTSKAI